MKQYILKLNFILLLGAFLSSEVGIAQDSEANEKGNVYVDEEGVMRWGQNNEEVHGFGVNYSAPFAHAYRTAEKLGVDLKKAIDEDVYHFSRLGFDLYRIHVWDTEISDARGNLLENEHLELFDYLVKKLKERDINMVITPIAFWGNGWPEPDQETPGFSHKYGKEESLTQPAAIKAQENYLAQFLNHVNPYTGVAYKDEPNVIAFEVSNEPHHRGTPEVVTAFIEGMVDAIRATGTEKPIFYNVSHSVHLADAYFDAGIDGGTFQWYPTGLGYGKELEGNLLPNVSSYEIPFDSVIKQNAGAKLVYEFDAADVMKSYMYPAMARSFRETGIQLATHFSYDPTFMAFGNTEYNTHYMNLAYTPQKALALMISGEIFHEMPMYEQQKPYSAERSFGDFHISYQDDLAEYNSAEKFIYTNSTQSRPKDSEKLLQLAGYGNSSVVKYKGRGAYFLDKLANGHWRLEVMPDAILVANPFGTNSLEKTVAVINHRPWEMEIDLPGLGNEFGVKALNKGNALRTTAADNSFVITPGTYLLSRKGNSDREEFHGWAEENLRAFVAPETTVQRTYVNHQPVPEASESAALEITAEIVSDEAIAKVEAWFRNGNSYETAELKPSAAYTYSARVPEEVLEKGFLDYRIIVTTSKSSYTYPAGVEGNPGEWDFYNEQHYRTRIVTEDMPVHLFNAIEDAEEVVGQWTPGLNLVPTRNLGEAEYQVRVEALFEKDVENLGAEPIYDYSFRSYFGDKIAGRAEDLAAKQTLVLKGGSLKNVPTPLQVALIMKNGISYGKTIVLQPEVAEYEINLKELKPVKTVSLPRPYPSFLQYYLEHELSTPFNIEEVESLQFSIGPGLAEEEKKAPQGVGIINVRLE